MPSDWLEWQRWRDWWRDFTSSIVRAEGAQATDRQLAITYALTLLLSWDLRYMLAELSRPGAVLPNLVAISPSLNQDIRRGNAAISALEKERAERTPAGSLEWTKFIDPKLEGLPEKPYEQLK